MLSPQTLERVSASYRRGYYDGHAGKAISAPETGLPEIASQGGPRIRPFADFDYSEGYKAGASDAKWASARR